MEAEKDQKTTLKLTCISARNRMLGFIWLMQACRSWSPALPTALNSVKDCGVLSAYMRPLFIWEC